MERRDWSLRALGDLKYIDSLEPTQRAESLSKWTDKYLDESTIEDFDLELDDLKALGELFYKNIEFLKDHREYIRIELKNHNKYKEFLH